MPDKMLLTRRRLQIVLMALAAAPYATNVVSEYLTWKRFFEEHPEQQLFLLSVQVGRVAKHKQLGEGGRP